MAVIFNTKNSFKYTFLIIHFNWINSINIVEINYYIALFTNLTPSIIVLNLNDHKIVDLIRYILTKK